MLYSFVGLVDIVLNLCGCCFKFGQFLSAASMHYKASYVLIRFRYCTRLLVSISTSIDRCSYWLFAVTSVLNYIGYFSFILNQNFYKFDQI